MPSKRKKNKRRMRKVQAQRKALEEWFASSGKGTPGVCAFPAPVPALVPVVKTSKCPVAIPIPLPVIAPIDVPSEVPPAVTLEVPVTDVIKDEVVKDTEDLGQTPVEPPAKEPDVTEEGESVVIPVSEVTSSIDEPVPIPAESEVQFEDTTPVATETHVVAHPGETVDTEREDEAELPAEDPVVEVPVPERVTTAETVAAVETVTETVVPEVEPVADATVEVDGHVVGVVEEPAVEAEAITVENEPAEVHTEVTEDVHAEPEPEDFPVEAAVPAEALVEPEPEQKQQRQQQPVLLEEPMPSVESTSDPIAEEFVVTESVAVDPTVAEEQFPETTTDAPEVLSEILSETIPAPEPLPVPVAKESIQAQDEFMPQVETETIKDLAVAGGLTVDAINGCLGATEVVIEG
ncbi:cell surface glycoprotein 1 isoform X1 [Sinocyclocheilus grahami]|uniref:cell surface glycoprotein 1 isoform X1 n=1 Tax=Sinocyclocheilus grahami TaxID=75366 RepID=UPI0007AD238B|nr:PREDICTED: cell surface glycoprotein 1-like isoform X1 [Sinocyclocheilus grahami]XP_016112007.1 PREDICTED: cell surface glycoprotein 1-like isoform X1 [Sinocyclocheilus grahami]